MATNILSSLLLSSLLVFAFFLMPMISGQMVPCLPGECTDSAACDAACKSKGNEGGACILISVDAKSGDCCCKANNFESLDDSSISDATNVITN
ncbi:unnamed protein product [Thlaspi arvense]|uniref:Uncharacterized protein n=1 Tax=Thlaspi arvense TaxID=13288 RepID=A0AAU9RJQ7_THLAR|nr:unnamed protein product [Thlaspi arvense]